MFCLRLKLCRTVHLLLCSLGTRLIFPVVSFLLRTLSSLFNIQMRPDVSYQHVCSSLDVQWDFIQYLLQAVIISIDQYNH